MIKFYNSYNIGEKEFEFINSFAYEYGKKSYGKTSYGKYHDWHINNLVKFLDDCEDKFNKPKVLSSRQKFIICSHLLDVPSFYFTSGIKEYHYSLCRLYLFFDFLNSLLLNHFHVDCNSLNFYFDKNIKPRLIEENGHYIIKFNKENKD